MTSHTTAGAILGAGILLGVLGGLAVDRWLARRPDPDDSGAWLDAEVTALARGKLLDVPDDVTDERPAFGWLTAREAAAIGQHPFYVDPSSFSDRCAFAGCGAVSADPIHFMPTGLAQRPQDATEPPTPAPEDPRP